VGRLDTLRLLGSGGANRAMEAEVKRLAPRSLGRIRLEKPVRFDEQTLVYPFNADLAWFAVRYLRTPSRVLWDLGETHAERLEPLYDEIRGWYVKKPPRWMRDGQTFSITVKNAYNFEAGPLQVRGTVKNALMDAAKAHKMSLTLDPDRPDVSIVVRGGDEQKLVISVDLGGQSLHARGYRTDYGEAPLKENLAAQMLMLARWDARKEILVDPMCGAGTIAIEGDAMARGAALWVGNKKPAASWLPTFAKHDRAQHELFEGTTAMVFANDQDDDAIQAARKNAKRAGATISAHLGDFERLTRTRIASAVGAEPDTPILVLTNPPYGERLELDPDLYAKLNAWWRGLGEGVRFGMLTEDGNAKMIFGRNPKLEKPLHNGPLKTRLLVYDRPE
jgi:23S rRNA G2445 N2-methylase RlmL